MTFVYNTNTALEVLPHIKELFDMHTYCRPYNGSTVKLFCRKYIDNLPGCTVDKAKNRIVRIGTAPILWSSHTDTVHKTDGKQKLLYGAGLLTLADGEKRNCLGADDSAGVWLMRQMILRGVEGLYIFHAGEEVGGIGSSYIADHTPGILDGIKYAIAFDRKGTNGVITEQFFSPCCSDKFAQQLCDLLSMGHVLDNTGTFTDTHNYVAIIPECTNLSVGYSGAHSASEALNVPYIAALLERLCTVDFTNLVAYRTPAPPIDYTCAPGDDYWSRYGDTYPPHTPYNSDSVATAPRDRSLEDLCWNYPEVIARVLADYGIDSDVIASYL